MDGQEYLDQISATVRPVKQSRGILSSKFFWVGIIGVVLLIVMALLGSVLGGGGGGEKSLVIALKLHLDNTSEVIQEYQSNVKSSNLRSSSASLYSILSNTNRDVTNYLTDKYKFKDKDISKNVAEEAQLERDGLEADLFEAKINGNLDRIYAHKMAYEVALIMSEEAKIVNSTKSDDIKSALTSSYNSLENLYSNFDDFSETK